MTRAQLRALGWTPYQIDHEIDVERWHVPAPGGNISVVALQNAPLSHEQKLWLGVLHAGPTAVLSHLTAVKQAGLEWRGGDLVDVLTAKGHLVESLDGFAFHQTRRPYRDWRLRTASGPPRLRPEYAALLAAERDRNLRRGIGLIAAAVQQRLTTAQHCLVASHRIRKLRNGHQLRLALGDIAGGAQSFAEIDLGVLCRGAGLVEPARQAIRRDKDGRRRFLDCEWRLPSGRVVVLEIDGSFHLRVVRWWEDMRRERAAVVGGSTVLRCSTVELRLQPDDVLDDLRTVGVPSVVPAVVPAFVWAS